MNDIIIGGIIGAGAAILSSLITSVISYNIAIKSDRFKIVKKKLHTAYNDISSFYQLEIFYTEKIAELENSTAESIKRAFREKLRSEGYNSPSRYSVPSYINDELKRYEI